jgi:4-hydroxy-tetrahydrodipicolinate synthase
MTTLGKAPHDRLFVASVTPWTDEGELDEAGFRALLRYFVSSSDAVDDFGIIVNPEAGEVFYLSPDEQAHVVEVALDEVGGQLPLWTGLLANSTRDMVALAERLTAIEVKGHRVGGYL